MQITIFILSPVLVFLQSSYSSLLVSPSWSALPLHLRYSPSSSILSACFGTRSLPDLSINVKQIKEKLNFNILSLALKSDFLPVVEWPLDLRPSPPSLLTKGISCSQNISPAQIFVSLWMLFSSSSSGLRPDLHQWLSGDPSFSPDFYHFYL